MDVAPHITGIELVPEAAAFYEAMLARGAFDVFGRPGVPEELFSLSGLSSRMSPAAREMVVELLRFRGTYDEGMPLNRDGYVSIYAYQRRFHPETL